jgi:hypothetical protein
MLFEIVEFRHRSLSTLEIPCHQMAPSGRS